MPKIFKTLWRWAKRRHPKKSNYWIKEKYFRTQDMKNWIFYAKVQTKKGEPRHNLDLISTSDIQIKRHIKIRSDATPYDPAFKEYFAERFGNTTRIEKPGHSFGLQKA